LLCAIDASELRAMGQPVEAGQNGDGKSVADLQGWLGV